MNEVKIGKFGTEFVDAALKEYGFVTIELTPGT
jgi:hypothetical protein